MVDKHAISPLNQRDKTPGQHTEDRAGQSAISRCTRRAFLGGVGMAGIATSAVPLHSAHAEEVQTPAAAMTTVGTPGAVPMILKVNGQEHRVQLEPRVTLLDALRASAPLWHEEGMRSRAMWGMHGARERTAGECLPDVRHHASGR